MKHSELALLILLSMGCSGPGGIERASVSGTVKLDGVPIEAGSIAFIPDEGLGPTAGAVIAKGVYQIEASNGATVGIQRIEIRSQGKSGRVVAHPVFRDQTWEETIEIVPARYNTESTLRRGIAPGHNVVDLELMRP